MDLASGEIATGNTPETTHSQTRSDRILAARSLNLNLKYDVKGYTFIMPSVAIGNVGQLAVDLLISNTQANKCKTVWDPSFIPVVGSDPYSTSGNDIGTSCDMYIHEEKKLLIMQLRSPLYQNVQISGTFLVRLVEWLVKQQFARVVILGSMAGRARHGEDLTDTPLRYICSQHVAHNDKVVFGLLDWKVLPQPAVLRGADCPTRETAALPDLPPVASHAQSLEVDLPESGFAKLLYKLCVAKNLPVVLLLTYCDEGCNTPEAEKLADYLNSWLHVTESKGSTWLHPPSWDLLYGNSASIEIF